MTDNAPTAETRYNARLSTAAAAALMAWEDCYPALTMGAGNADGFSRLAAAMRSLRRCL